MGILDLETRQCPIGVPDGMDRQPITSETATSAENIARLHLGATGI